MIEFFNKERAKVSYGITTKLIEEVNKIDFTSEGALLDWAREVEEKHSEELNVDDYLFLLSVAYDGLEEK